MIKSIALAHRKTGMTREEYNRYWKEQYAPLAARLIPGVREDMFRIILSKFQGLSSQAMVLWIYDMPMRNPLKMKLILYIPMQEMSWC